MRCQVLGAAARQPGWVAAIVVAWLSSVATADYLWVSHRGASQTTGTVTQYDENGDYTGVQITGMQQVHTLAINPVTGHLWAAEGEKQNQLESRFRAFDAETGEYAGITVMGGWGSGDGFYDQGDIAFTSDGTLYAAGTGGPANWNYVKRWTGTTWETLHGRDELDWWTFGLTIDSADNYYYALSGDDCSGSWCDDPAWPCPGTCCPAKVFKNDETVASWIGGCRDMAGGYIKAPINYFHLTIDSDNVGYAAMNSLQFGVEEEDGIVKLVPGQEPVQIVPGDGAHVPGALTWRSANDKLYVCYGSQVKEIRTDGTLDDPAFLNWLPPDAGGARGVVWTAAAAPADQLWIVQEADGEEANQVRGVRLFDGTGAFTGVLISSDSDPELTVPRGIAVGPDGDLYVSNANETDGTIRRYDCQNGTLIEALTGGVQLNHTQGITFGPDGNLYIRAGMNIEHIVRFVDTGGSNWVWDGVVATFPHVTEVWSIVFGPEELVYASANLVGQERIFVCDLSVTGENCVDFIPTSNNDGMNFPHGLAFGPDGKLFIASVWPNEGKVMRFFGPGSPNAGNPVLDPPHYFVPGNTTDGPDQPSDVKYHDGYLYVLSMRSADVRRYDLDGNFVDEFVADGSGGLYYPQWMAFASAGSTCTGASISSSPASTAICQGEPVTLEVTASGTAPLTYQWRRDGAAIGGANESSYTIAAASVGDAGDYDVVVTNACGSVTSAAATLTVYPSPTPEITASPRATVCEGTKVDLDAGAGYASYLWSPGGQTSQNIVVYASGTYSVEVTDAHGCANSVAIEVTIAPFVLGDFDCDGDVDLDDYAAFSGCLVGPSGGLPSPCRSGNFDLDADVDLDDFSSFQEIFNK